MSIFRRTPVEIPDEQPPLRGSRAVVGAAQRVRNDDRHEADRISKRRSANGWQDDAWAMYDAIGEIKYGFNLVAWAVSRIRIFVAVDDDRGGEPVAVHDALDLTPGLAEASARALRRLDRGVGIPEMLRTLAINMQVAGDCWLVQQPEQLGTGRPERWSIKSVNELKVSNGQYSLSKQLNGGSQDDEVLPPNAYVARLWRAHPRFYENADSSMLGILELCDELLLLHQMIRSVVRSRSNAGILAISEDFALLDEAEGDEDPVRFEEELQYSLTQSVSDESAASAVMPTLVRGPLDQIERGIKYHELNRSVSSDLIARADRVLERILQGIDLPKDVVTGLAQVKYSNALVISDSLYQAHIEPLIQLICDQLTDAYLRPAVPRYGFTDEQARRLRVWYDASEILTDSDRSDAANQGFDRNAISYAAWRRENGFPDTDAPTANELVLRVLMARASLEDPTAQSIIRAIAPTLMGEAAQADQASTVGPLTPDVQDILGQTMAEPVAADPAAPESPPAPATPAPGPAA